MGADIDIFKHKCYNVVMTNQEKHPQNLEVEQLAVQQALGIDPTDLNAEGLDAFNSTVSVAGMFSRVDRQTGAYQTISPKRIRAIPVVSLDYASKQSASAGKELGWHEIESAWRTYTPTNDGSRHPDLLFDVALEGFNWTEESVRKVVDSIMDQKPSTDDEPHGKAQPSSAKYLLEALRPGVNWDGMPDSTLHDVEAGIFTNLIAAIKKHKSED